MDINIKRMNELNKIRDQIRHLRSSIKNDASTIERFKRIGNKECYYTEQIQIRISKNIEREKEIKELENRICDVKEGVYAFQLIYNENQQVILVKPLDWTKVLSTLDCWSYDGGKNFKYSSIETLKLDIQKIRELKLDKILA